MAERLTNAEIANLYYTYADLPRESSGTSFLAGYRAAEERLFAAVNEAFLAGRGEGRTIGYHEGYAASAAARHQVYTGNELYED